MEIIINGRNRRFIGGDIGGRRLSEIWLGGKKIWPNPDAVARQIVVALPQPGTQEWQYWVHAVDSTKHYASFDNYMRIVHNGMSFFINNAFDGTEPYILSGNTLSVELDGISLDEVGSYLDVDVRIPQRYGPGLAPPYGEYETKTYDLPLLPGTQIRNNWYGGRKGKYSAMENINIIGQPSGYPHYFCRTIGGNGRGNYYDHEGNRLNIFNPIPSDTSWTMGVQLGGYAGWLEGLNGQPAGLFPTYPGFRSGFKLKVLSVS